MNQFVFMLKSKRPMNINNIKVSVKHTLWAGSQTKTFFKLKEKKAFFEFSKLLPKNMKISI